MSLRRRQGCGRRVVATALAVLVTSILPSCSPPVSIGPGTTSPIGEERTDWLLVLYLSAANELEEHALHDLDELESVDLRGTGITVVCLLDRPSDDRPDPDDRGGATLFQVLYDPDGVDQSICSLELESPGLGIDGESHVELDLADPTTLDTLMNELRDRFWPSNTVLAMSGFGQSYEGVLIDRTPAPNMLSFVDLAHVLANHHINLVALETSFSASIEIAYQLKNAASYLIGSQGAVPPSGWAWGEILARFVEIGPSVAGFWNAVVESEAHRSRADSRATVSAIDLSLISAVYSDLDRLSISLYDFITSHEIRQEIRETLFYDVEDFYETPGDLFLDLGDLGKVVGETWNHPEASELVLSVNRAVVAHHSVPAAHRRATGLSVHYIPLDEDGIAAASHRDTYVSGPRSGPTLDFVSGSHWTPKLPGGPGLLYRLFYEALL